MPNNGSGTNSDQGTLHLLAEENLKPVGAVSASKMRLALTQTAIWVAVYLIVATAPLMLVLLGTVPQARSYWVELGVAMGIVGFSMMLLQFVNTARFRWVAPFFGSDAVLLFHRQMGIIAFLFIVAHPLILIVAEPRYLEFFDPRVNALRTLALVVAMIALTLVVALSLWRERLGLVYEWWRLTHGFLAVVVVFIGLVHALQVNWYVAGLGKQLLWVAITVLALAALAWVRLVRPWLARRTPYRVAEVRPERDQCWTLVLEAEGHAGMKFHAGQFTWLTLGDIPFKLQQHPFSIASSAAESRRIELTMKDLGDFTGSVKHAVPGGRAFLEGPFGSFTLEGQPVEGAVLIMGGIGITPAMSILRTCRDRGDRRPLLLIYANKNWEDVTFREELEELQSGLNLKIVHALEDPPEDWHGETGFVTPELLERHLPRTQWRDQHFFVCGPPKMMEIVEKGLAAHGIPIWNRSVENFGMV